MNRLLRRTPAPALARILPALAVAASLSGCCDLARYLCGPEDQEWVSESFTTPQQTLATLKEGFRRDDHIAILGCFSQRLRREFGVTGTTDTYLLLEQIKEETPGLHMLGYAELESLDDEPDGRKRAVLEIRGRRLELLLAQQAYWQLAWLPDGEEGAPLDEGAWLENPRDLRRYVAVSGDDFSSSVSLNLTSDGPPGLRLDQIRAAGVAIEWKVDGFELVDEDS